MIMRKKVASVSASTDQEEVALLLDKPGFCPAGGGRGGHLLGITVDDVMDVINEETTKTHKMAPSMEWRILP